MKEKSKLNLKLKDGGAVLNTFFIGVLYFGYPHL